MRCSLRRGGVRNIGIIQAVTGKGDNHLLRRIKSWLAD